MIETKNPKISVSEQCRLLGISRSGFYYHPVEGPQEDLKIKRLIDEQYTRRPFYGSRRMRVWLRSQGYQVNRKKIQRLMREMGIKAIYPKPKTSQSSSENKKYPYLLRGLKVGQANQVWCADITYIRMREGFMYLVAIMDWFSRYVLSWELSNSLETDFCLRTLERALRRGCPEIFNTDQGVQFTNDEFTGKLKDNQIQVSMDGKGRAIDNVLVERLWRSVKYEEVYLNEYENAVEAREGLSRYFEFYNHQRPHQSLGYKTPAEIHRAGQRCLAA